MFVYPNNLVLPDFGSVTRYDDDLNGVSCKTLIPLFDWRAVRFKL